jgi:tetratricopeptide (TPR) repeat protein
MGIRTNPFSPLAVTDAHGRSNRLIGWKAIGLSLGCTARTARRWETSRGLPVHRIKGGGRGSVWAAAEELQAWLQSMPVEAQADLRAEADAEKTVGAEEPPDEAQGAHESVIADSQLCAAAHPAAPMAVDALPPPLIAISSDARGRWRLVAIALAVIGLSVATGVWWKSLTLPTHSAAAPGVSPYADDPQARTRYMNARFELSARSPDSLLAAEGAFKQLVERYPERAAGWSGLADTYLLLREFGSMTDESAYTQADRAARAALALDPKLADAWLDRAFIDFWWNSDSAAAFRAFETALQLDPRSAKGYHWYATALSAHGDFDRSLAVVAQARALDPGNRALVADEAWLQFVAGKQSAAISALERLVQVDPDFVGAHSWLARCYLTVGRDEDFLREATLAAKLRGQEKTLAVLSVAADRWTEGGRAALLDQLSLSAAANWRAGLDSPVSVAGYRALAGDRAGMMQWLEVAEAAHDHDLLMTSALPYFAPYRRDPDFSALMARLR